MEEGCDYRRVYSSRGCCWSTGGTESGQACEKRLVKSGKNTLKNAIVEGTMDGSLEALSGGDFKRGFENGVIGSVIPGKSAMVTGLTGAALSVKDSILASRKGMKNIKCQTVIMNAVGSDICTDI